MAKSKYNKSIKLTKEIKQELKERANKTEIDINFITNCALADWLNRNGSERSYDLLMRNVK